MAENTNNTIRITGVTISNLPEGTRLTFVYCILDKSGNTLESNKRDSFVILNDRTATISVNNEEVNRNVLEAANTLFAAAKEHLNAET